MIGYVTMGMSAVPMVGPVIGAIYLNGGTWFLPARWRLLPSAVGVLAEAAGAAAEAGALASGVAGVWAVVMAAMSRRVLPPFFARHAPVTSHLY